MSITAEFMEAVEEKKITRVRIMLKDSLLIDPTSAQFDEMEKYARENLGNIYEEHDGEKLNYDTSAWNEDYLNEQMVKVITCFSKERIELLKDMVRYLYREKARKIRMETTSNYEEKKLTRKQAGAGVAIAGAVVTVAGICTSHTILTVGGVVVAATGIALMMSDK